MQKLFESLCWFLHFWSFVTYVHTHIHSHMNGESIQIKTHTFNKFLSSPNQTQFLTSKTDLRINSKPCVRPEWNASDIEYNAQKPFALDSINARSCRLTFYADHVIYRVIHIRKMAKCNDIWLMRRILNWVDWKEFLYVPCKYLSIHLSMPKELSANFANMKN